VSVRQVRRDFFSRVVEKCRRDPPFLKRVLKALEPRKIRRLSDADYKAGRGTPEERREYEERLQVALAQFASMDWNAVKQALAEIRGEIKWAETKMKPLYDTLIDEALPLARRIIRVSMKARSRPSGHRPRRGSRADRIRELGVHSLRDALERAPELLDTYPAELELAEKKRRLSDDIPKAWKRKK